MSLFLLLDFSKSSNHSNGNIIFTALKEFKIHLTIQNVELRCKFHQKNKFSTIILIFLSLM